MRLVHPDRLSLDYVSPFSIGFQLLPGCSTLFVFQQSSPVHYQGKRRSPNIAGAVDQKTLAIGTHV